MTKTITTTLALLLWAGISQAQFTLHGGQAPLFQLVKQPYFYYDLMRDQQTSWTREYRENASQAWQNSNLFVNRKNANGEFDNLEYSIWNPNSTSWDLFNKMATERVVNGAQLAEELRIETVRDEQNNLREFNKRSVITWENGRPEQISKTTSMGGTQLSFSRLYFHYDASNRRIHDSEAVNDNVFWGYKYVYNNLGQCIANYQVVENDTINLITYGYTNHLLTSYRSYYYTDVPVFQYEELYEYDTKGRIIQSTISGDGMDSVIYKHGYNNDDLLLWMCSYYHEDGEWNKSDSVAVSYTGTHADTSYGYLSTDFKTWNSWPSFRFLFDDAPVGVKENEAGLDFSVYPNPASGKITVSTSPGVSVNRILLSDLTGKTIMNVVPALSGEIDVTGISPGIYIMRAESKAQSGLKKIIIY